MKRTACNIEVTPDEARAYSLNRGILADAPAQFSLDIIANHVQALMTMKDNRIPGSTDYMAIKNALINLRSGGVCMAKIANPAVLTKSELLTLIGQIQRRAGTNNTGDRIYYPQLYFHMAARHLRSYLYANYQVSNGAYKGTL